MKPRWGNARVRAINGKPVGHSCPACSRRTYADENGKRRCECGWHEGMTVVLPLKPKIEVPGKPE